MFVNCCGRKKAKTRDAETQSDNDVLGGISNVSTTPTPSTVKELVCEKPVMASGVPSNSNSDKIDIELENDIIDDDDVFCEGVVSPIELAGNLGAGPPVPKWFSKDEDEEQVEVGGIQEPPATPIGKDELALRRHRFFSELMIAAQNASEHKVHFDPLGPVVAGVGAGEVLILSQIWDIHKRACYCFYLSVSMCSLFYSLSHDHTKSLFLG